MRITVLSPVKKQGVTSISMLLGLIIAKTQKIRVCWTHTGMDTDSFYAYSGLEEIKDITMSIGQVARLLEANAISGDEISDYCQNIEDCLDILNTAADGLTPEDSGRVLKFVLDNLSHDLIITDVDTDLDNVATKEIILSSDLIICIVAQDKDFQVKFDKWCDSEFFKEIEKDKIIYIVNKYDSYVCNLRETTAKLQLVKNRCSRISYNPFIIKFSSEARLSGLMRYILDRDERVISLHTDLRDSLKLIMTTLGHKFDWREQYVK